MHHRRGNDRIEDYMGRRITPNRVRFGGESDSDDGGGEEARRVSQARAESAQAERERSHSGPSWRSHVKKQRDREKASQGATSLFRRIERIHDTPNLTKRDIIELHGGKSAQEDMALLEVPPVVVGDEHTAAEKGVTLPVWLGFLEDKTKSIRKEHPVSSEEGEKAASSWLSEFLSVLGAALDRREKDLWQTEKDQARDKANAADMGQEDAMPSSGVGEKANAKHARPRQGMQGDEIHAHIEKRRARVMAELARARSSGRRARRGGSRGLTLSEKREARADSLYQVQQANMRRSQEIEEQRGARERHRASMMMHPEGTRAAEHGYWTTNPRTGQGRRSGTPLKTTLGRKRMVDGYDQRDAASPEEHRRAPDGGWYTKPEFREYYGAEWRQAWLDASPNSLEHRMAQKHGFETQIGVASAGPEFYASNQGAKEMLRERLGREGSPMRIHAGREKLGAGGRLSKIDGGLTAHDDYMNNDQGKEHWEYRQ